MKSKNAIEETPKVIAPEIKTLNVKYKDKIITCVTLPTLATMCGKTYFSMQKYVVRGLMPKANIKKQKTALFTVKLANKLTVLLSEVKQGKTVEHETKRLISLAFQEEKIFLNSVQNAAKKQ